MWGQPLSAVQWSEAPPRAHNRQLLCVCRTLEPGSRRTPLFHPTLQNQYRRHFIHRLPAFLHREVSLAQQPVGLGRGEAFVPEMNRDAKVLAQFLSEDLHFVGLIPLRAAHAQRQPYHNLLHVILTDYALKMSEVMPLVLALERLQPLRGYPEWVRNRDSDAAGAYVEAQDAADLDPTGIAILGIGAVSKVRSRVFGIELHGRDYMRDRTIGRAIL